MDSSESRMEDDDEMKDLSNAENMDCSVTVNNSSIAPVIIEEFDESTINEMEMDLGEFVEAKALKLQAISKKENKDTSSELPATVSDDTLDCVNADTIDEQETETNREDQITQQFLNGELTFTEYSLKMDNNRLILIISINRKFI